MKAFFKVLSIVLLVIATGLIENAAAIGGRNEVAQAQSVSTNTLIPITLPTLANVVLKNGESMTGLVSAINPHKRSLQISLSGASRSLQITQVQRVTFRRDALVYTSDGRRIIRGDDTAVAKQSTWQDIPLSAFRMLNPSRGQASVSLAGVVNPKDLRGIRSVAENSLYVVDEIQFNAPGKMTIKVTPTDR